MGKAEALPRSLAILKCGCRGWTSLGSPEGLLKQGSWSPRRLGLPLLGGSQKVKQPEILGCSRPRENWGRKKERKEMFQLGGEMSLLVSRVRV